jgi:hypothetical protein
MLSRSVKIILTLPDLNVETPGVGLALPARRRPGDRGRQAVPLQALQFIVARGAKEDNCGDASLRSA